MKMTLVSCPLLLCTWFFWTVGSAHAFTSLQSTIPRAARAPSRMAFSSSASLSSSSLVLPPPTREVNNKHPNITALILMPGCLLKPNQYESLAKAIQQESDQAVWIVIPKLAMDMANPLTVPRALRASMQELIQAGFPTDSSVFVGGHSLGGIFLPDLLVPQKDPRQSLPLDIAGLVQVGCFVTRAQRETLQQSEDHPMLSQVPQLVVSGDLDGLIRVSRIAEDVHANVLKEGNSPQTQLHHSVVLVPGMNHFELIDGNTPPMKEYRDLKPEISKDEAIQSVASTIGEFIDCHGLEEEPIVQKSKLLNKISATQEYLSPLLEAMALEGNYHMETPCHYCDDDDDVCDLDCAMGSPWAAKIQKDIMTDMGVGHLVSSIQDEFHESWRLNPFANPPFYHPKVHTTSENSVKLETVTEAVYEKPDYVFDGGFFSNTALELRSKFNSPESVVHALQEQNPSAHIAPPSGAEENICSKMNAKTIEWALEHAPEIVKKRYLERGIKLQAGRDISHNSGPSWIWTHLDFNQKGECGDGTECRIVDSHTMKTPIDHPIPFAGGKVYCKLLSPARVLDWMYTDSLRGVQVPETQSWQLQQQQTQQQQHPIPFFNFTLN